VEAVSRGGIGIRQIYLDLLEPALRETGRLWERGELRVAEEHAISEAARRIMSRIFPPRAVPAQGGPRPHCFAVAASSERHAIGLRMVSDFLRLDAWDVLFLEESLSIRHVIEMLAERTPDLLAVSVTLTAHLAEAGDLIATVREKSFLDSVKIIVGGQAFESSPRLWREIGADGTAANAETAVGAANRLTRIARPPQDPSALPYSQGTDRRPDP
jgi:methanogenic corrinoid protein MtbC1